MTKKTLNIKLLRCLLILHVLCLTGCPVDPAPYPVELPVIQISPNAFTIKPLNSDEYIHSVIVTVLNGKNQPFERAWKIRAAERIKAKGFVVVVGELPSGFEQVIPSNGLKFVPAEDKKYDIEILTKTYKILNTPIRGYSKRGWTLEN